MRTTHISCLKYKSSIELFEEEKTGIDSSLFCTFLKRKRNKTREESVFQIRLTTNITSVQKVVSFGSGVGTFSWSLLPRALPHLIPQELVPSSLHVPSSSTSSLHVQSCRVHLKKSSTGSVVKNRYLRPPPRNLILTTLVASLASSWIYSQRGHPMHNSFSGK